MIVTRPIFDHDQARIEKLLLANANDLNWAPEEVQDRASTISILARLGTKAIRTGEISDLNGDCLGVAILSRGDHASTKHAASLRLLVDRGVREQGIGSALVRRALYIARGKGILRVEAQPYSTSDFVDFWAHAGFKYEGRRRNAARSVYTGELVTTEVWAWYA